MKYQIYDPENNVLFSGSNKKTCEIPKICMQGEGEGVGEFLEDLKYKI